MTEPLPIVSLENVSAALEGSVVLRGLHWKLRSGENWAVVGPNGSGKSTFLKLVRGDLWPVPGIGQRLFFEEGQASASPVGWREQTAFVSPEMQERYLRLEWTLPVHYVVCTGFFQGDYVYGKLTRAQKNHAREVLEELGIGHLKGRNVQCLSTGELRRVLIARALVAQPRCLFLDEFVDGLDPAARAHVLETIDRVARTGTQIIYTTHRREELVPALTHVLELGDGSIREQREFKHKGSVDNSAPRELPPHHDPPGGDFVLRLTNCQAYVEGTRVLREVHWTIRPGQNWAITGANGAGKSTLLKLISGDLYPRHGGLVERWNGEHFPTIWDLRRRIGFLSHEFQTHYRDAISGRDLVASGFFSSVGLSQKPSRRQWKRVDQLLAEHAAETLAGQQVGEMSFGQMRKLLLLRALVHAPRLLILDEPYDGLDESSRRELESTLNHAAAQGTTLVMVTHHVSELPACITHLGHLESGRLQTYLWK